MAQTNLHSYGAHLKEVRTSRGWSQKQMAQALGIEQATVSRLEKGEWEPSKSVQILIDNIDKVASA